MIIACPECSARFRLAENRYIDKKRLTLRCARCQKIFQVDVSPRRNSDISDLSFVRVLVAHGDPQLCATIQEVLNRSEMECLVCSDGDLALSLMEQSAPHVVVLDVALPGLYAFEAVEKIRHRPGLDKVKILLVSSVYNKTAYKRTPVSLYGADGYIEKHHIPGDLVFRISQILTDDSSPSSACESAGAVGKEVKNQSTPTSFVERMKDRIHDLEAQEGGETEAEKARRFARIIVADIALYSQPKVDAGIVNGNFFEAMATEIVEGQRLFEERFSVAAGQYADFLHQAFCAFVERRQKELLP
ncbi:response regulator [Desulfuromonas sp. AOP6]|uniref:response regulator n=1 Tax=Desulfuromonas sp. AOP6 TaxID=1566351 RepID=UPI00126FB6BB|nr:response regulator [Desulfuromonas sp. AOP6]BCA80016.1 hypothetical protein AOP6_1803 [Desulfuromonas sp. AOP6]